MGVVARLVRTPGRRELRPLDRAGDLARPLDLPRRVTRVLGLSLFVLAVAAGRIGLDDQLDNLAPALVIGAGWPLLLLGSAVLGDVWRWVDPWDTLGRVADPPAAPVVAPVDPPADVDVPAPAAVVVGDDVRPAVVGALALVWFLSAFRDALQPRAIGAALAAATLVALVGCLLRGRVRWLAGAEPIGLLSAWIGLLPRRRLPTWAPPRGATALLGVVGGGLLFGAVRSSELWVNLLFSPLSWLWSLLGVLACAGLGAGIAVYAERLSARAGAPGTVAAALVPMVAAIGVAVALAANRFTTSMQILPQLLGDPFGRGWDTFGEAGVGLIPEPLGIAGLAVLQLVVAMAGASGGAAVALRRVADRRAAAPALVVLGVFHVAAVLSLVTT